MSAHSSHPASPSGPVLVVGASGTMGGATLAALGARGVRVRALVRRPHPGLSGPGVEQVVADLADPAAVLAALRGVRAAFYVSPHAEDEEELARIFVTACAAARVRIVFAGVHVPGRTLRGRLTRLVLGVLFPAYRPKLRIGRLVERTAPDAVLLVPTNFYDNDDLFLDDILAGSYPSPLRGVNRVAASDIGAAAARVLLDPGFPAGSYPVCGPRSYSGAQSAAVWAEALDSPVRYTGDDPDAWRVAADRRLPVGRKGRDYRATFGLLGRLRFRTAPAAVARTAALLGRQPLRYPEWVQTRAQALLTGTRSR